MLLGNFARFWTAAVFCRFGRETCEPDGRQHYPRATIADFSDIQRVVTLDSKTVEDDRSPRRYRDFLRGGRETRRRFTFANAASFGFRRHRPVVGWCLIMNGRNAWWRAWGGLALVFFHGTLHAAPPEARLQTNDVVALVGGGAWVAEQRDGYLETALRRTHPGYQLRVRNFAWEGDTVSTRPREVNYPSVPALLRRFGATVTFLQFGQSESYAGAAGLAGFRRDYQQLLEELAAVTPRLVLVTPLPFESKPPPGVDLGPRNGMLARYVDVIRALGREREVPVMDLFLRHETSGAPAWTTDGRQLSDRGEAMAAWFLVQSVASAAGAEAADPMGWFAAPPVAALRTGVRQKNQIWMNYVRPTNWAFLAGDRTEQLSSRDHRDHSVRWFPGEMEQFVPLLQQAERQLDHEIPAAR